MLLPLFLGRSAELLSEAWFQEEFTKAQQDKGRLVRTGESEPVSKREHASSLLKRKSIDRLGLKPSDLPNQEGRWGYDQQRTRQRKKVEVA